MAEVGRMTCPTCGRDVAVRLLRGPRVNAGRPIPALRVPTRHLQPGWAFDDDGEPIRKWCPQGQVRK
jgi:hypothetical protein